MAIDRGQPSSIRPVLKHGPRSLALVQVLRCQHSVRNAEGLYVQGLECGFGGWTNTLKDSQSSDGRTVKVGNYRV